MPCHILVVAPPSSATLITLNSALSHKRDIAYERIGWEAARPNHLCQRQAQLVIADATTLHAEVLHVFQWLRDHPIPAPILAILPRDRDQEMLSLTFQVADDFLLTPVREEELSIRVTRILGNGMDKWQAAHESLMQVLGLRQLVGNDPAFASVIKMIPVIARSGLPALITGETGTGKELCARAIHHLSSRRDFPFIPCDCAAIPDHLFENELFGHTRGAYTDAHSNQKGVVAMADGGTLFLDEVDALSLVAQAKLLRFLQERAYRPLGAERFVQANVNVIAAPNREIEDCVRDKQIRSDLYYRLNVARLKLPPLRGRRGDIELLARHFLNLQPVAADAGRKAFLPATLRKLTLYDWPGNVRELLNVVQRAILLAEGQYILPEHISLPGAGVANEAVAENFRQARARAIEEFEKRYVEDLLCKHDGNVTRAALEANKDRRAFGRLKKKYKIK